MRSFIFLGYAYHCYQTIFAEEILAREDPVPNFHESRLLANCFNATQRVSPNNRNDEWTTWFTGPLDGSELYGPVSA